MSLGVAIVAPAFHLHAEDKPVTVGLGSKVWVQFKTKSSGDDHLLSIHNGAKPCYGFQESHIDNEDKTDAYWWEKVPGGTSDLHEYKLTGVQMSTPLWVDIKGKFQKLEGVEGCEGAKGQFVKLDFEVKVPSCAKLIIASSDQYICVGDTKTFEASGGHLPYKWSVTVDLLSLTESENKGTVKAMSAGGGTITFALVNVIDSCVPVQVASRMLWVLNPKPLNEAIKVLSDDVAIQLAMMQTATSKIAYFDNKIALAEIELAELIYHKNNLHAFVARIEALDTLSTVAGLITIASANGWAALLNKVIEYIVNFFTIEQLVAMGKAGALDALGEVIGELAIEIEVVESEIEGFIVVRNAWQSIYDAAFIKRLDDLVQIGQLQPQLNQLLELCDE